MVSLEFRSNKMPCKKSTHPCVMICNHLANLTFSTLTIPPIQEQQSPGAEGETLHRL